MIAVMKKAILLLSLWLLSGVALLRAQDATDELLAAQYFRDGQYDKAVVLYESLFEKNPTPVIYNNYLECLFALDEHRKAERVVRGLTREHPEQVRYEVDLGWVMQRAGNDRQARRQFDRLIRNLESSPRAVRDLAAAFENRAMYDHALETYMRGRRMLGSAHSFHLDIAPLYERMGRYNAMMEEYINYLDKNQREMDQVRGILQDAITNDPGFDRNDALREVLLDRTQSKPNNTLYSEMLLWLSLQQKDFRIAFMQARALDRRMQMEGELVLEVANTAASNRNYAIAGQAFQYVMGLGENAPYYLDAITGYLDVRFREITSSYDYTADDLHKVETDYKIALDELGVNAQTIRLVRNLANLQAFYLGNTDEAVELLQATLNTQGISNRIRGECRVELADILVLTGQVWDANLLYSQVDKTFRDDPLAHEAKFKNARLSFYIGEFDWAKAQLDVLKAGTSRLIANDAMKLSLRIQDNVGFDGDTRPLQMYARAEKLIFMNRFDEALMVLDSVTRLFPTHQIHDDVLFAKAEIFLRTGQYQQADSLLERVVEVFPQGLLADEALFKRAEIQERIFDDKQKAMTLYQKLMMSYPGSLNTITARNRFRALRGDMVN
jgi:tetratricopeptide (TPR) repeat protein